MYYFIYLCSPDDSGGADPLSPPSIQPTIQGENIITWTEPGQGHGKEPYDMALSFQDEQGCREIWWVYVYIYFKK